MLQDLQIRPIEPGDKPELAAAVGRLSAQSLRRRFLAAKPTLSRAELRYLTEVDGDHHIAFVAVDGETIVGVARCVRLAPGADVAEFAIVVGDECQRQGVGTALAIELAEAAC